MHRQTGSNGLREIVGDFGHRVDQRFPRCRIVIIGLEFGERAAEETRPAIRIH